MGLALPFHRGKGDVYFAALGARRDGAVYLCNAAVEVGNDAGLHRHPAPDFGGTAATARSPARRDRCALSPGSRKHRSR
jgi:hypothetical protein